MNLRYPTPDDLAKTSLKRGNCQIFKEDLWKAYEGSSWSLVQSCCSATFSKMKFTVTCATSGSETHVWGWYTVYKLSGSYYGTFQCQNLMFYISIDFRPLVLTQSAVVSWNQLKPLWSNLVHTTKRNSLACHITSDLDFNKGGYVIQIEWTKALC